MVDERIRMWCTAPDDHDALHDARTALRRLRVLARSFQTDLGSLARKHIRREMRSAFRTTSGIRDRHVFSAWLLTLPSSQARRLLLRQAQAQADASAVAAVKRLPEQWGQIHRQLMRPKRKLTGPARHRSFGAAVDAAIRDELREIDQGLSAMADSRSTAAVHEVRIAAKRLRYLLEALAGRPASARPSIEWCRQFQDLVGDWRDALLASRRARACPPLPGRTQLIDRLTERRRLTRADVRRFIADRAAWTAARRDALTVCHRYRVLGAGTPIHAEKARRS